MAIQTVGVVGTGVIGASWTGLFLAHGLRVLVSDPAPGAEKKLQDFLEGIWPTLQSIGLKPNASLSNYTFVGASMDGHYAEVDFIQENAPERLDLKTKLLGEIDAATRPEVVIASSSSGIPSSQFISKCAKNPGRVLIGHPFNPPHLMPLVEVVPHPKTDKASVEQAIAFYQSLDRNPVHIRQEVPGFAANRLQAALCNEAYSLVSRGILSAQDLDACVTTSLGPRWAVTGPLLANAMGGGGGSDGFKHLLEHLGPASQSWAQDMQKHAFQWDTASLDALSSSVAEELKLKDIKDLERQRDEQLVELFRMRRSKTGGK
ncbi:3-hydroxyacyl-CoA dehydrogenase, NAD binding domain-containing protein [Hirsutella rhossiliensis]|uniref:L-gulonate 3-dehydrogenase n=1 Tax=Hirsutella rhossiliensis TaxID=111463 RepID=A0A9P8MPB3_9HYPO|nr:3-hydroxyacyl-CoA dehydrogenase, NAD binding domain-containing protein [Hirsutella rhossiliensis]KAH0958659.1 3-hydroxyacyl-CoA dehydrogenase, NAD binding domain-containing protein [Hirsutella rhossiliensis]